MTVDEWALRDAARELADLYAELDALKHTANQPRGERVMRPRPGPRTPGNWYAIALDADLVDRLVEYVCDARNHIEPGYTVGRSGRTLCNWIAFNAARIAELDFADDVLDELHEQSRRITRHVPDAGDARRPEQPQSAKSICHRLVAFGLTVSPDLLRKWAERGHIPRFTRSDGRAGYRLADVLDHITRKAQP